MQKSLDKVIKSVDELKEIMSPEEQESLENLPASVISVVNITIKKANTVLSAAYPTFKIWQSGDLKVKLTTKTGGIIKNAKIKVEVDGKTYTKRTDTEGVATFSLKFKKGKHAITISYAGSSKYVKSSKKFTINVTQKQTPKITAKDQTFKQSVKAKKVSVTLKNANNQVLSNKPVTLKVDNKTYKAKTNEEGVAVFNITQLTKAGTYTATVRYAGNSTYNAKSVKIQITVKK